MNNEGHNFPKDEAGTSQGQRILNSGGTQRFIAKRLPQWPPNAARPGTPPPHSNSNCRGGSEILSLAVNLQGLVSEEVVVVVGRGLSQF